MVMTLSDLWDAIQDLVSDNSESETEDQLLELKKELAERMADKFWNKDIFMIFWKDLVVDYLVDEWTLDKLNDAFKGWILNIFSSSMEELKNLRQKIKDAKTEEDLKALESSFFSTSTTQDNITDQWYTTTSTWTTSYDGSSTVSSSEAEWGCTLYRVLYRIC